MIEQIIGFLAGACIAANMIPQILKSFKTKKVEDVSMGMLWLVFFGSVLWLIYGFMLMSGPIIFSDGFGTATSGLLILIKLKYNK